MDQNDPDHKFSDGDFAYYQPWYEPDISGDFVVEYPSPVTVMTYNNDNWHPSRMDQVFAHETGHVFGAPDEYSGADDCDKAGDCAETNGFLHVDNGNCEACNPSSVTCLMRSDLNAYSLCSYTVGHFGWTDTDGDGPSDAIDPNYCRWASVYPVFPGDVVRIYTLAGDLVRTIACTEDNVDLDSPTGYVIWDALNNKGYQVAPGVYMVTVNFSPRPNISTNACNLEVVPELTGIAYSMDTLTWGLTTSWGYVRCFIYDESTGDLIGRPVWDGIKTPGCVYSTVVDTLAVAGPAYAEFFAWRPDGGASDTVMYRICECGLGDLDGDGDAAGIDLGILIDILFAGAPLPDIYPSCPLGRIADMSGDGWADARDLGYLIDYIYAGGAAPVDPCE